MHTTSPQSSDGHGLVKLPLLYPCHLSSMENVQVAKWCVMSPSMSRIQDINVQLARLEMISTQKKNIIMNDKEEDVSDTVKAWSSKESMSSCLLKMNHLRRSSLENEMNFLLKRKEAFIEYPSYFSSEERTLVHEVAAALHLSIRILPAPSGVMQVYTPTRIALKKHSVNEVAVNVPEMASQGHDTFLKTLRLTRFQSDRGQRAELLWELSKGNNDARPVTMGEGGVYSMMSTERKLVAMFKPSNEETFNREGISIGEGAVREEAAYVLDRGHVSSVPATAVARLNVTGKVQLGSVQRFMANSKSLLDFQMPSTLHDAIYQVSIHQIHKIALLDLRMFNTDRHFGNILMVGDNAPYTLIPIDHGCVLPSWFHVSEGCMEWSTLPQAQTPFQDDLAEYIAAVNVEDDAFQLRRLGIREECITTMILSTTFLQLATAAKKTVASMAKTMCRTGLLKEPCAFENMILQACFQNGIPFTFENNIHGEATGRIDKGILSRRPPPIFFTTMKELMKEYVTQLL